MGCRERSLDVEPDALGRWPGCRTSPCRARPCCCSWTGR